MTPISGIAAGVPFTAGVVEQAERTAHYRSRVEAIARAQGRGDVRGDVPPAQLLYAILALAVWWSAAPQLTMMITGPADVEQRRTALLTMVRALTAG